MNPNPPRLRYLEVLTLGYLGCLALVLLWRRGTAGPGWWAWLAIDGAIAAAILQGARAAGPRLTGPSPGGLWGWVADLYPLPLFILLYRQSEALNRSFFAEPLDPIFFAIEAQVFGFQPSLSFAERFPATALAEVLYAAYFAFYPLILGFGAWVIARDREDGRRFLGTLATVFYACYGCFLVFPVVGPRILDLGGLSPQALAGLGLTAVTPMSATSHTNYPNTPV